MNLGRITKIQPLEGSTRKPGWMNRCDILHDIYAKWDSTDVKKICYFLPVVVQCVWYFNYSISISEILYQLGYSATPYLLVVWLWIKCLYPKQNTMVFCHGLKQPARILKIYVFGSHISMAAQWSLNLMEVLISTHCRLGLIDWLLYVMKSVFAR